MRSSTLFVSALLLVGGAAAGRPAAAAAPDLIVRQDVLAHQWVVRDENLQASLCSVIEGGVISGEHKLLRFTVMAPNIGDADINIGDPRAHFAANDGLFEMSTCHNHFHFRNYTKYELIDPATGKAWRAAKHGFCMIDTDPVPDYLGDAPPKSPQFKSCGTLVDAGNQGISHGWADTYRFYLGGQYFVLDGGDGQEPVPPGDYIIRITVNPAFKASKTDPCRVLDPATGLCHNLPESNFANNVAEVLVTIPEHPGKVGVGPGAGLSQPSGEPAEH